MAMLEKFPPMGYVRPENWRRFMAKNGSGRVLSLTSAATTVVGTVASCHPWGTKAGVEIISPLPSTLAEDCNVQCSRRASLSGGAGVPGLDVGVFAARTDCALRNETSNKSANRCLGKARRAVEFILLPRGLRNRGPWSGIRGITCLLIRFNGSFYASSMRRVRLAKDQRRGVL